MYPNENFNFLFNVLLLLFSLFFVLWTVYLRSKREILLKKYKKDSRYRGVEKMLGTQRLVVALVLVFVATLKMIFDTRNILDRYGDAAIGDMLSMLIFGVTAFLVTLASVYYVFLKNDLIIKP